MAAEGQCDKIMSDMEVCMKQRCVSPFLHMEKMAPTDIHRFFLNISGGQRVDVSTVKTQKMTSHVPNSHAQLSRWEIKSASVIAL